MLSAEKEDSPERTKGLTMGLQLGETAPDFEAETTQGPIKFHDWIGDSWAVLFSHPKDFTPICTTELGYMARIEPEFAKRGVKIIGLSVDATGDHEKWADDIEETQGTRPNYPSSATPTTTCQALRHAPRQHLRRRQVTHAGRQPDGAQRVRHRAGQEGQVDPGLPDDHGPELRRGAPGHRLAAAHGQAPSGHARQLEAGRGRGHRRLRVSNDEAKEIFGTWKEPKPYIRIVPQPS